MPSEVQLVRELWRAHETGGLDAFFAAAGDDVVWQPFLTGNRVFRGTAQLREALTALAEQGIRYEPQLHDLEQHGNVVLVHGALRVSNNGGLDERRCIGPTTSATVASSARAHTPRARRPSRRSRPCA